MSHHPSVDTIDCIIELDRVEVTHRKCLTFGSSQTKPIQSPFFHTMDVAMLEPGDRD